MKKILIFLSAMAILISPLLPWVFADTGTWTDPVEEAVWEYDFYRIERLGFDTFSKPYNFHDVVFVTDEADACDEGSGGCEAVDLTIFDDGQIFDIENVDEDMTSALWQAAQGERFLYRVVSNADDSWGSVYEYDQTAGTTTKLMDIPKSEIDINFMTFAVDDDRVYFGTLNTDEETGSVGSELSVYDYDSGYERDDFTYQLTAPWQEIVDVQDGLALVKFQFSGGFKQLWLVDQTARQMEAIPDTWTENPGDIVAAHFLSDGSIRFFRNYRLFSYNPETDSTPTDAGGAYLSWFEDVPHSVEIVGDRMAYIDSENGLYVSDLEGVSKFGVALNGSFHLDEDAIYFQNVTGDHVGYSFSSGEWETMNYLVTDTYEDIRVGIDSDGDIWYENLTNGYLLNIGYGNRPVVLSDREHAYWQGEDGNLYEVTFSPLLDLERADVQAFSSLTSQTVYLVEGDRIWMIPDETIYFTWFDSWDHTLEVSQETIEEYLNVYDDKGDLKFAPGTRVKAYTSVRVYVVGSDYKLHWIVSETVADEIYGSDWNQGIVEVNDTYLWKYANGSDVTSVDDVRTI